MGSVWTWRGSGWYVPKAPSFPWNFWSTGAHPSCTRKDFSVDIQPSRELGQSVGFLCRMAGELVQSVLDHRKTRLRQVDANEIRFQRQENKATFDEVDEGLGSRGCSILFLELWICDADESIGSTSVITLSSLVSKKRPHTSADSRRTLPLIFIKRLHPPMGMDRTGAESEDLD